MERYSNSNKKEDNMENNLPKLTKTEKELVKVSDEELLKYFDYLVEWIKDCVRQAGMSGVVVGVSGGVDSAVVAKLAREAFPEESLGVSINLNNFPNQQKHAREVISNVGIKHISLSLSEIYSSLWKRVDSVTTLKSNDLAKANMKPRLRMTVLYYIAAKYNYLVLGTDNADEIHLGYFTKHGDGGVDIMPLANLNKSQVRRLAMLVNFSDEVANQVPSADLWINQTDETEMGVTYNEVDSYLNGDSIDPISETRIKELHEKSEHKRSLPLAPSKKIK